MFFLSSSTKTDLPALLARLLLAVLIPAHAVSALAESKADSATTSLQTAVFAGGCFWGVDAVFKHVKGVANVESGYAGGSADKANYEPVSSGRTGHAEAVRVRFNPAQVSYQQLLQVFFVVAHDPTQLNHQGPDVGSQYRSAIFFADQEQQETATDQIQKLTADRTFGQPIVTQIAALQQFYPAESYHQNYLALHPTQPYIVINDQPKIEHLRREFPDLYQ
jgi:peptide-methionine (S)-S-oxide reductase